ncbi:MAG: YdbL family protein [Magnetococcales bacterium]|nr:YdbL family protein [Magnetococcales bacterium]
MPHRLIAILAAIVALITLTPPLSANPLSQAKSAGILGEKPNGYVGVVAPNAPPSARQMAKRINQKRRAKYQEISRRNGAPLSSIEAMVGKKLQGRVQPGEFYMTPSGSWVKR